MKKYIGVTMVEAAERSWTNPNGTGPDIPGYVVTYPSEYVGWLPKEIFDAAYKPVEGMTFGHAIEAMKSGNRVARKGWNGKGMWLCLSVFSDSEPVTDPVDGQLYEVLPYIVMKTADNKLTPWLASQTDMLAEDWQIVECSTPCA